MFHNAYSSKSNRNLRYAFLGLGVCFAIWFILGLVSLITDSMFSTLLATVLVNHTARLALVCFTMWIYLREITSIGKLVSMNGHKKTLLLGVAFSAIWFISFVARIITGYGAFSGTLLLISVLTIVFSFLIKIVATKIAEYVQDSSYDTSYIISQIKSMFFRR